MNIVICSSFPLISPFEHAFCLEQLSEQCFCSRGEKVREIKFSQQCWHSMEQQRPLCFKQENVALICAYPLHKNSSANQGKALSCFIAIYFYFLTQGGGSEALDYIKNTYIFNIAHNYCIQIFKMQICTPMNLVYALYVERRFVKLFLKFCMQFLQLYMVAIYIYIYIFI